MTTNNNQENSESISETKQTNRDEGAANTESRKDWKAQVAQMMNNFDKIDDSIAQTIADLKWINNQNMQKKAEWFAGVIALEMGLEYVRTLPPSELVQMVRKAIAGRLPTRNENKFCYADVVIEATDGDILQYIAVEASSIADTRDTTRALRNASMLTEYTGRPARAAIASARIDPSINGQIESGAEIGRAHV